MKTKLFFSIGASFLLVWTYIEHGFADALFVSSMLFMAVGIVGAIKNSLTDMN